MLDYCYKHLEFLTIGNWHIKCIWRNWTANPHGVLMVKHSKLQRYKLSLDVQIHFKWFHFLQVQQECCVNSSRLPRAESAVIAIHFNSQSPRQGYSHSHLEGLV